MNKSSCFIAVLLSISFTLMASSFACAESCDVEKVIGAKVSQGNYRVNVKRESSNMYKVTGQEIYIKTRMCLELAIGDDAILEIKSASGSYVHGELHFLN